MLAKPQEQAEIGGLRGRGTASRGGDAVRLARRGKWILGNSDGYGLGDLNGSIFQERFNNSLLSGTELRRAK